MKKSHLGVALFLLCDAAFGAQNRIPAGLVGDVGGLTEGSGGALAAALGTEAELAEGAGRSEVNGVGAGERQLAGSCDCLG